MYSSFSIINLRLSPCLLCKLWFTLRLSSKLHNPMLFLLHHEVISRQLTHPMSSLNGIWFYYIILFMSYLGHLASGSFQLEGWPEMPPHLLITTCLLSPSHSLTHPLAHSFDIRIAQSSPSPSQLTQNITLTHFLCYFLFSDILLTCLYHFSIFLFNTPQFVPGAVHSF